MYTERARNLQPACILLEGKSSPPQYPSVVQPLSHSMSWQVTRPRFPTVATGTAKGFSALTYEASFVTRPASSRLPSVQATAVQALPVMLIFDV